MAPEIKTSILYSWDKHSESYEHLTMYMYRVYYTIIIFWMKFMSDHNPKRPTEAAMHMIGHI